MRLSAALVWCCVAVSVYALAACSDAKAPSADEPGAPLPMCGEGFPQGCVQPVDEARGLIYTAGEDGYAFRLLTLSDSEELQSFTQARDVSTPDPMLLDVNLDGASELFVPVTGGMSNTLYRVWRLEEGRYVLADEVGANTLERDEQTGLLGVGVAVSAVRYSYDVYGLGEDGLEHVYTLESDLADGACVLMPGPGFDEMELDADALLSACEAGL